MAFRFSSFLFCGQSQLAGDQRDNRAWVQQSMISSLLGMGYVLDILISFGGDARDGVCCFFDWHWQLQVLLGRTSMCIWMPDGRASLLYAGAKESPGLLQGKSDLVLLCV